MTLSEIKEIVVNLEIDHIKNVVKDELNAGTDPREILRALSDGLDEVGRLYEQNEYFLTDLILAGETMKDALEILGPKLKSDEKGKKDTIVLATVKGDNHDIGKNILLILLISAGFDVIDLGINCPAEKIVKEVKKTNARIIALSALLTMTIEEIANVDIALKKAGLREKVKIIVGGAPLTMKVAKEMGADDYAADAIDGVRHIRILLGE